MALILCSVMITGAMAGGLIAAVMGPQDDSALCYVNVYSVTAGAGTANGTLLQSVPVSYDASAVTFDANENLLVGEERINDQYSGVYVVDKYPYLGGGQWNTTGTEVCVIDGGGYPLTKGMAVDKAGSIYIGKVNYSSNPAIYTYKYNNTTGVATPWATFAAGTGCFDYRIDPTGNTLWVSSVSSGIWGFNLATAAHTVTANGGWNNYNGFDINPVNGNIYGGSWGISVIDVMSPTTGGGLSYYRIVSGDPRLNKPESLVFGPDWNGDSVNDIYVADQTNANIQVFNAAVTDNWGTSENWIGTIPTPVAPNNLATYSPVPLAARVTLSYLYSGFDPRVYMMRVNVMNSAGTVVATQTVSANPKPTKSYYEFDFQVAPGNYTVQAFASKFLSQSQSATVTAAGGTVVNLPMVNGDINGDNFVEDQDYSIMGEFWYQGGD
jgi:hypothetical protein